MSEAISVNDFRQRALAIEAEVGKIIVGQNDVVRHVLVSILAGALMLQMLLLRSWNHPSIPRGTPVSLLMVSSIFLLYLLGMVRTHDLTFALYELKKVIFWVVIPAALYYSPRLNTRMFVYLLLLFIMAVVAASFSCIPKRRWRTRGSRR